MSAGLWRRLPGPLRNAVAGAYGRRLRRQRYGPETDRLIAEAHERERDTEAMDLVVEERLRATLRRARVAPHYAALAPAIETAPRDLCEALARWPVLEKEDLRRDPASLRPRGPRRGDLPVRTSGTTGTPLALTWSREAAIRWYALVAARLPGWHGLDRHARWGHLGGRLVAPIEATRPPFWVWNGPLRQLYLSSYHLHPANVGAYWKAIDRYGLRYLLGYTSSLHELAVHRPEGAAAPSVDVVFTNAEPLAPHQRRVIEEAFRCPVRETYGMAELAAAASECEAGRLHQWPEVGVVETVDREDDGAGTLLLTGLLNDAMSLVRYRVGDRATPPERIDCSCGRTLPVIRRIEGRTDDVLRAPDGRAVGRLDPVFKGDLPLLEAQIVQEALDRIRVLVVAPEGWRAEHAEAVRRAVRERMGDVHVEVTAVPSIPRGPQGKFRAVIQRMRPEGGESRGDAC